MPGVVAVVFLGNRFTGEMMTADPQVLLSIAAPAVAVIVWLVRLEGRINLADSRHADIREDLKDIKTDLRKIRSFIGSYDRGSYGGGYDRPGSD